MPAKRADKSAMTRETTITAPPTIQVLRFTPAKPFASSVFEEEDCSGISIEPSKLSSIGIVLSTLLHSFALEIGCS